VLTITLSEAASETVTVNYATSDNTATNNSGNFSLTANANNDYTSTSGTATILAGQTTATIEIPIYNDPLYEGNEIFTVTLSSASGDGATISDASATVTITDNEIVNPTGESNTGANATVTGNAVINGIDETYWNLDSGNTLSYTFYDLGAGQLVSENSYSWSASQQQAVVEALQAWANVLGVNFQYVDSGSAGVWNNSNVDHSFFVAGNDEIGSSTYAFAYQPSASPASGTNPNNMHTGGSTVNQSYVGDVYFNSELLVGGVNQFSGTHLEAGGNGWNTILHEIGHALGFSHSWNDGGSNTTTYGWSSELGYIPDTNSMLYTNMSYNVALWTSGTEVDSVSAGDGSLGNALYAPDYAGTTVLLPISGGQPYTPMAYDIVVAQNYYGANTFYNAGDTTYSLDSSTILQTIWDAGGEDTLDASGLSSAISLDLTPAPLNPSGAWINGANISATSNTMLAYDVYNSTSYGIIENAIAGSGDDLLIGNTASNALTGGAGDDTLTGGAGSDIFVFNSLTGSDTISDWSNTDDTLQFSAAVFSASGVSDITAGNAVNASDLLTGDNITDASSSGQTFLVDTDSGVLYYDADGTPGGAVQVVDLGTNITIYENDIVMIA